MKGFSRNAIAPASGAAGMLKTPDMITAAARLLGAEAEHAAAIRTHIARLKIPTTAMDGVDLVPPPSGEARQVLVHFRARSTR